jgi:oxalate decarboxylase
MAVTEHAPDSSDVPEPIRGEEGATILGPRNVPLERENPSLLTPRRPTTAPSPT